MQIPFRAEDLINFLYLIYRSIRDIMQWLLENTIVKANPSLAANFADSITLLASLTAILLILEFVSGAKKVLAIIVAFGWLFLTISMAFTLFA